MWVGLGIMKTVAAPIYFGLTKYRNHNTNANKKKRTLKRIL